MCPDDFTGFKTKAVKKIMKETVGMGAGGGGAGWKVKGFKTWILKKFKS